MRTQMKINIQTIPHAEQRYDTVGDYWTDEDGTIQVRVSELGNPVYEQAVVLHELMEYFLCLKAGIKEEDIMAFDVSVLNLTHEPGDLPDAPYRREHCFATSVEMMFIAAAGENWDDYDIECGLTSLP